MASTTEGVELLIMPRTISTGIVDLAVGTYTYNVNGFNSNNTDYLILTIDRINFPLTTSDLVMRISLLWNSGDGARFDVNGGVALDRSGQPLLQQRFKIGVPGVSNGSGGRMKGAVNTAAATVEVFAALQTAFTLAAE